jgi:hypothetical protein
MRWKLYVALFAVLLVGIYTTYKPHLEYPYPLQIDEWEHFAMAEEATLTGEIPTYWPIYKNSPDSGTMKWERNYHSLLAVFFIALPFPHELTMVLIPSILSIVLMLSSFVLMRYLTGSDLAGIVAAVLVVMMKSNITLMGPWFAVPSAAGLALTPLIFYLFLKALDGNRLSMLFTGGVFASTALMTPHVIVLLPVMGLYFIAKPRRVFEMWKELVFFGILLFGLFLAFIPSFLTDPIGAISQFRQFSSFGEELVDIKFNVFTYAGSLPFLLSIVGIFFSVRKFKEKHLLLSCFLGFLLLLIFLYNQYDIMLLTMYRRAFLFLIEAMYLMAVFGCFQIYKIINERNLRLSYIVFFILFAVVVYEPITTVDLYSGLLKHYITDSDYESIIWMRDNLADGSVILATPEISTAIPPIAHKFIANYAYSPIQNLNRLLQYPCSFEGIRLQYGITHVYNPGTQCTEITFLGEGTYLYN